MSMHRATRFLIDKVDNRLGDVDKEIKFDKTMISGCLGIVALEIILLSLSTLVSFFSDTRDYFRISLCHCYFHYSCYGERTEG